MTPFQLVSKSLQCTYELLGQKGGSIPDTVELTVTDLSISFNNIKRRTWSEMINKISQIKRSNGSSGSNDKRSNGSSGSNDVVTVQTLVDALKTYCTDGKRSNRGLGSRAIVSSLLGANASQMGSCQTLTFRDACCRIQSRTI